MKMHLGAGERLQARHLRELHIVADLDADARQRRVEDLDLLARLDVEVGAFDGRDVQRVLAVDTGRSA
jgi:hypothetical protein